MNKPANSMKHIVIVFLSLIILIPSLLAQENKEEPKKEEKPVKNTFESDKLINMGTSNTLKRKQFQFDIQHRFGRLDNGFKPKQNFDFFGMFAPANIRFGLNYGITHRLTVGIGGTKNKYLYDINWKYKVLEQTQSGSMPITLTYFGNASYLSDINFETRKEKSKEITNRLSYFHQLLIARKFSDKISLQLSPAFAHFNLVEWSRDSLKMDSSMTHDNFSVSLSGQFVISAQSSIIFECSYPVTKNTFFDVKPDLGIGWQISTGAHAFQIVISTANSILPQYNTAYNANDFTKGEIMLGFNIVRRWQF